VPANKLQRRPRRSQEEIFAAYNWWDRGCLLYTITDERGDYVESCVVRVLGKNALRQQQVLEIGCGGGLVSEELARREAHVVGLDPSSEALEAARTHARQGTLGARLYFMQGYAEHLPFADGSFSVIVCLDVLEHVRNLHTTMQEIARVLAPGGVFIFDTINRTLFSRIALLWIGERFFAHRGLVPGLHSYRAFIKPAELTAVLSVCALQVGEMVGFMPRLSGGQLKLGPGWFKGVSYAGYATKGRF
jgi:2-polyprenyl-6-hydroxyphenyl methylase / 3-demethylubiquinone-9 3-methyltransferase